MMLHGWIGVDLDGTLATFDASDPDVVGPPIPAMVQRVKRWLQEGREVRIVTARAARQSFDKLFHRAEKTQIEQWCVTHLGQVLPIQAHKDYSMIELWDDRVVQVELNTGRQIGLSRVSVEAPDPLVAADVSSLAACIMTEEAAWIRWDILRRRWSFV